MNITKVGCSVFFTIAKMPSTVLANTKSLLSRIKSIALSCFSKIILFFSKSRMPATPLASRVTIPAPTIPVANKPPLNANNNSTFVRLEPQPIQFNKVFDSSNKPLTKPGIAIQRPQQQSTGKTPRLETNGLKVKQSYEKFPQIRDAKRDSVKKTTLEIVKQTDITTITEDLKKVHLFTKGAANFNKTSGQELLGRFDVLAVPAKMDYDYKWDLFPQGNQEFFIHHAAAINIGENPQGFSEDFKDYTLPNGQLDENRYLSDMRHIFNNLLASQEVMHISDAVWFPFGMGAFLRHLDKSDPQYADPFKLNELRKKIAIQFFEALDNHPDLKIHLCLPNDFSNDESESTQNCHAFLEAAKCTSTSKSKVELYINVDATTLAQNLANNPSVKKVSLVNGANRKLIGNHWFGERAKTAIDENLHRRSSSTSVISNYLNETFTSQLPPVRTRNSGDLEKRVKDLNGHILYF